MYNQSLMIDYTYIYISIMIYCQVHFQSFLIWRAKKTNIFLETLKKELDSRQLTQKWLSEKTGISVNTIRGWFSKNLSPDVFNAFKIAKALNTSVEYLVTGEQSSEEANQLKTLKAQLIEYISNL